MQRVVILGAGGHAQVVADILLCAHDAGCNIMPVCFLDDNPTLQGQEHLGVTVLGPIAKLDQIEHDAVIVAIGHNATRQRLFETMLAKREAFATALHPTATISRNVKLGPGTMVCAGVVVNTGSRVGANVILNTGCNVDHHNIIHDHAHIAPGAHLGGDVSIGEGSLIGIGSTIMPQLQVGNWSCVGAGACLTKSIGNNLTVVGVPARPMHESKCGQTKENLP